MKFSYSDAYLVNPVTNERLEGWGIDESSSGIHASSWKHTGSIEKIRGCSFLLKDDFNTKTVRCWRVDQYADNSVYLRFEEVENMEFLEGVKYLQEHPVEIRLKPIVKRSFWERMF